MNKISCSSCDPALYVHENVNHHQDNTHDQHVNTSLDHSWLSRCEGPNDHWVLLRSFSILRRRKKKDDKKTKAFYDWTTTGIPVKNCANRNNSPQNCKTPKWFCYYTQQNPKQVITCHEYCWIKKNTRKKVSTSQISMALGNATVTFLQALKNIAIATPV